MINIWLAYSLALLLSPSMGRSISLLQTPYEQLRVRITCLRAEENYVRQPRSESNQAPGSQQHVEVFGGL